MDIEELTTSQIILLVLLVSFVTSIATGIVTVSLLAQAPPAVTQTVNRIVERTVETVVPQDSGTREVVKETTVVVKEDDLITDSVVQSLGKTGRVHSGVSTSSPVTALATQVANGILVTDSSAVSAEHMIQVGSTDAIFLVSQKFPEIGIAILVPKATSTPSSVGFRVGDTTSVKLGQTVIALVSVANERVSIGSVGSKSSFADVKIDEKDTVPIRVIETNITENLVPGTPLVNIHGDLLGVSTSVSKVLGGPGVFISTSDIIDLLSQPRATSTPQQ